MLNKAMQRKLDSGEAIDVSDCPREGPYYVLASCQEGKDYCDAVREVWIWSIGRRHSDGVVLASTRADLYQNPEFDCLWLR